MILPFSFSTLSPLTQLALALWPDCVYDEEYAYFQHMLGSDTETCFLAKDNDNYIGFIQVSIRNDYVEGSDSSPVAYIEGIYVDPGFRQKGIALQLIDAAEQWAREKGLTQIASDTEIDNRLSILFHQKAGFAEAGRLVCFIKHL